MGRTAKTAAILETHAWRRCLQRYGVRLSNDELEAITRKVRHSEARFVVRQSVRVTVWDVDHAIDGIMRTFRVVYDRKRHAIATFLALDMDPTEPRRGRRDGCLSAEYIARPVGAGSC